jgi:hypothetical protein
MDPSNIGATKQVEALVVYSEHSKAASQPLGERTLDTTERDRQEECMWQTAWLLVHTAIEAHRRQYGIDRTRALHWIRSAIELTE